MKPNFLKMGRAGALTVATLIACASAGCTSMAHVDSPPQSGPVSIPAAPRLGSETQRLTFLFVAPAGYRTAGALKVLRHTLTEAGYRLTLDPKDAHEARIDVRFAPTGDTDTVEMTIERDGRQIESVIEPFTTNDASMRAALDQLVVRLTLSPRLALLTKPADDTHDTSTEPTVRYPSVSAAIDSSTR